MKVEFFLNVMALVVSFVNGVMFTCVATPIVLFSVPDYFLLDLFLILQLNQNPFKCKMSPVCKNHRFHMNFGSILFDGIKSIGNRFAI